MLVTLEAGVQMAANFCLYSPGPGEKFPRMRGTDLLHEFRKHGFFTDFVTNNPYGRLGRIYMIRELLAGFVGDALEICLTPYEFEEAFLVDVVLRSRSVGEYDVEYWLEMC